MKRRPDLTFRLDDVLFRLQDVDGLGPTPAAALSFAANKGLIDRSRILGWVAHPSKSGGSQVSAYLGERKVEELKERDPVRYRADTLLAAAAVMRDRINVAARTRGEASEPAA